jgi:hypothetical protein
MFQYLLGSQRLLPLELRFCSELCFINLLSHVQFQFLVHAFRDENLEKLLFLALDYKISTDDRVWQVSDLSIGLPIRLQWHARSCAGFWMNYLPFR